MAKINLQELTQDAVNFDSALELVSAMRKNIIVWSWGARDWARYANKVIFFRVNGHLLNGRVFMRVNGLDLFDIYACNLKGDIKKEAHNVYIDDLIDTIDRMVETK